MDMSWFVCVVGLFVLSLVLAAVGAVPPGSQPAKVDLSILKTLRLGHPRLIALPADLDRVRRMIQQHEQPRLWHAALTRKADELLVEPALEYKLIGPRLLQVSRAACDRIYTLGLLYRLDGDRRFADRGIQELLAVCKFETWHPDLFLDTAEMTHAVAIGYDWFYDRLTADQRATVRQAIVEKGLKPAANAYRGGQCIYGWWVKLQPQLEPGLQRRDRHRRPGHRRRRAPTGCLHTQQCTRSPCPWR